MSINTNSTSLVTVTYTGDKWLMLLQAHSIEKFIIDPITHYVIIDDRHGNITSEDEWRSLLEPIYKKHNLVLLTRENQPDIFLNDEGHLRDGLQIAGWTTQQYCKLAVSKFIDTEWYVVLDTKNIFIKSVNSSSLVYEGADQLITYEHPAMDFFGPFVEKVCKKFNKPNPKVFWFPGTPFGVKTAIVKNIMENDIDSFFINLYKQDIPISEFILYRCFVDHKLPFRDHFSSLTCGLPFPTKDHDDEWAKFFQAEIIGVPDRCTITVFRDRLDIPEHRKRAIHFLTGMGLDLKYVEPGIMLDRKSMGH